MKGTLCGGVCLRLPQQVWNQLLCSQNFRKMGTSYLSLPNTINCGDYIIILIGFLHFFVKQRIPSAFFVIQNICCKKEHIVQNHTAPGRHQTEAKKSDAYKCSDYTHSPHSYYAEKERNYGITQSLQNSLNYNGNAIEGF